MNLNTLLSDLFRYWNGNGKCRTVSFASIYIAIRLSLFTLCHTPCPCFLCCLLKNVWSLHFWHQTAVYDLHVLLYLLILEIIHWIWRRWWYLRMAGMIRTSLYRNIPVTIRRPPNTLEVGARSVLYWILFCSSAFLLRYFYYPSLGDCLAFCACRS